MVWKFNFTVYKNKFIKYKSVYFFMECVFTENNWMIILDNCEIQLDIK